MIPSRVREQAAGPKGADDAAHRPKAGRHLELLGVSKSYGSGRLVVRDVSFTLHPGKFLTLLGPSGSGKTTTLMMVAGFETPTAGHVRVNGADVAGLPPNRRNFGVVFQGYGLFPHMSVLQNVEFPLRMRRLSQDKRRDLAMAMLDKVGLEGFSGRRPAQLSGGQQQRVALARALVFEPDALLLDEPLGALDKKLRDTLQAEIKALQARVGISILYVTHDQDEAMMMSDEIAIMNDGQVIQMGAPADIYLHPRTAFVAGFLGETNLIPCVHCGSDGKIASVKFTDGTFGSGLEMRHDRERGEGKAGLLSIRPEAFEFLTGMATAPNQIDGRVSDYTFLGRHERYVVAALGQNVIVSQPGQGRPRVRIGDAVRLTWAGEKGQLLSRQT